MADTTGSAPRITAGLPGARGPCRVALAASRGLLALERVAIIALMSLLLGLILLNVVTRYSGSPIYWVDEAAVYSVVWLTFIGASSMSRLRLDFSVTLLSDRLNAVMQQRLKVVASIIVIGFAITLAVLCWRWMDPLGLAAVGFNGAELGATTFNFLYTERTQTLEWPTWVLYLILPIFAVCATIHGVANLIENLGWAAPQSHPDFSNADAAEGVA